MLEAVSPMVRHSASKICHFAGRTICRVDQQNLFSFLTNVSNALLHFSAPIYGTVNVIRRQHRFPQDPNAQDRGLILIHGCRCLGHCARTIVARAAELAESDWSARLAHNLHQQAPETHARANKLRFQVILSFASWASTSVMKSRIAFSCFGPTCSNRIPCRLSPTHTTDPAASTSVPD